MKDLLQQVGELQELVRRLNNIREIEEKIHSWFQALSVSDQQPKIPHKYTKKGGMPMMQKNGG